VKTRTKGQKREPKVKKEEPRSKSRTKVKRVEPKVKKK
jgi:hypothetical protein